MLPTFPLLCLPLDLCGEEVRERRDVDKSPLFSLATPDQRRGAKRHKVSAGRGRISWISSDAPLIGPGPPWTKRRSLAAVLVCRGQMNGAQHCEALLRTSADRCLHLVFLPLLCLFIIDKMPVGFLSGAINFVWSPK